jgi:DNA-binding transcriptional MocR family regulator
MDDLGLVPQSLRDTIARLREQGRRIKFLYTIPSFQNPMGVTLSWERRMEVLEIARENDILVVEDNPYGLLYFDQAPPQAMRSVDEEGVIYLGTFSKTLAPGLRVGWAVAPHAIREKLILANEAAVLSPSSFTQHIVTEYLNAADWKGQIDTFRGVYRERRDAMLAALDDYLPDLSWTNPAGGFYVWVTLPDNLDSKSMLPRAVKELVAYTPGTAFYADGRGGGHIRLSFCYPTPEQIRVGVKRLANVVNDELELIETFGPTTRPNTVVRATSSVSAPPPNIS